MKINRETLLNQIEQVLPGITPRELMDQTSCLVFQNKTITTFNDLVSCSIKCPLSFTAAVPAIPLVKLLRKLTEDILDITISKNKLIIKAARKKATLAIEEDISLPLDALEVPEEWYELSPDFLDAVSMVTPCAGKNENDFDLTCVHITDSYIEACNNREAARYKVKTSVDEEFIVPKEAIKHIISLNMTLFSETDNWVHFSSDTDLQMSCRRYVEPYRDIDSIFEIKGKPWRLPKALKEAADKASIFSSELDSDSIKLIFDPPKLKIIGRGLTGRYKEILKTKYKDKKLSFRMPPKLLINLINRDHNECQITKEHLRIDAGKYTYVTLLETS